MSLNYAQSWSPDLLKILIQESLCSPFINSNVKWLGAKTFHFTQLSTSGFKPHARSGGWNSGVFNQQDDTYTVAFDRDIQFLIDKADVDETNQTASIQNISNVFQKTQVVPEMDAYFFSAVAQKALNTTGYFSLTAASTYTTTNVYSNLKTMLAKGKLRRYRAKGALIVYVSSLIMNLLEQSKDFVRQIELTSISNGGTGLETRVTNIDGVPIMEVIDDERFYDKFDFSNGFNLVAKTTTPPVTGSRKINVLIASQLTTHVVPKISSIYFFNPGAHTAGDGYLYQNRQLSDVFVFPNGKDNAIDSVFVDVDTVEYAG